MLMKTNTDPQTPVRTVSKVPRPTETFNGLPEFCIPPRRHSSQQTERYRRDQRRKGPVEIEGTYVGLRHHIQVHDGVSNQYWRLGDSGSDAGAETQELVRQMGVRPGRRASDQLAGDPPLNNTYLAQSVVAA